MLEARPEQLVIFLGCHDIDETERFYRDTLGLEPVLDQGRCRILRVAGEAFLGFCQKESFDAESAGVITTLASRDVEALYETLRARGVRFDGPLRHNPEFSITHAFFRDPNGYLLELQRFDDPRWPAPRRGSPA